MILHALIALLCAVALSFIGRDCYAWLPRVQRWLLKCAAARVPAEIRQTYHEECLAEIEQLPSAEVFRTLRAFGFLMAAWRIGLERINAPTLFESVGVRSFDIAFSVSSIIVFWPLCFVIALVIKGSDEGPIMCSIPRVGQGAQRFGMYRFRTTYVDSEERLFRCLEKEPHLLEEYSRTRMLRDDPRITRPGKWLRRLSLDKLPLFLNVLRGEMAVVGPMPCPLHWFQNFSETTREAYLAFKPGLTSPAVLRGLVGEDAYIVDCDYMKKRNFVSDVRLLLTTVAVSYFPIR